MGRGSGCAGVSGGAAGGAKFSAHASNQILKPKSSYQSYAGRLHFRSRPEHGRLGRLTLSGKADTKINIRFGEVLKPNGDLYTENLRTAEATDTYTLRGKGTETFEPHFTFHGFRYVELTGYPGTPAKTRSKASSSTLTRLSPFSSERANRL